MSLRIKTADGKEGWIMEGETPEATAKIGRASRRERVYHDV